MRDCCNSYLGNLYLLLCPVCKTVLPPKKKCGHRIGYKCCCNIKDNYESGDFDLVSEMKLHRKRNGG